MPPTAKSARPTFVEAVTRLVDAGELSSPFTPAHVATHVEGMALLNGTPTRQSIRSMLRSFAVNLDEVGPDARTPAGMHPVFIRVGRGQYVLARDANCEEAAPLPTWESVVVSVPTPLYRHAARVAEARGQTVATYLSAATRVYLEASRGEVPPLVLPTFGSLDDGLDLSPERVKELLMEDDLRSAGLQPEDDDESEVLE